MRQAEYDYQDFDQSNQSKQDEALLVKFFVKQVNDKSASLEQGRPIFKDVEYVDIKVAGSRTGGACRPATHRDKQRFPRHYEAFQKRIEMPVEGTPLAEWPMIHRSLVEELAFHNVKTVEQLVEMSDNNASKFMGINDLKKKAAVWLEGADDTARINEIESLKADNESKDERIGNLENLIEKLSSRLDELEPAKTTKSPARKPRKT